MIIKISQDFSEVPLGRYKDDGDFNGERFREEFLLPALRANDSVTVDINDLEGLGSSFLEEAFGGLVRKGYFSEKELIKKLAIIHADRPPYPTYNRLIWSHIEKAQNRVK